MIETAGVEQLLVCPLLHDLAVVDDDHLIGVANGA
jgi:hypothetical protein